MLLLALILQAGECDALLRRLGAHVATEQIAAAKELGRLVRRPPEGAARWSDKPVDRPASAPILAPETYDRAAIALAEATHDLDPKVREAAGLALAGVHGDRPAVHAALVRALASRDQTVADYVVQAFSHVRPPPDAGVPALIPLLDFAFEAGFRGLRAYGPKARAAVPELLLRLAKGRSNMAQILEEIGVDEAQARTLAALDVLPDVKILKTLLPHAGVAADYLPKVVKLQKEDFFPPDPFLRVVGGPDSRLRRSLLARPDLPPLLMAWSREGRFRDFLLQEAAKADRHARTFLQACLRACGAPAERVVTPGEFKPRSAWPGTDQRREGEGGRSGCGFAEVLVTGRLVMADGTPPTEPRFINENDRFLLGRRTNERGPLSYDPEKGRFVFYTTVFAAYMNGGRQPGPYQTGSAQVRVEAVGATPLVIHFHDEMPDIKLVLTSVK